MRRDRGDRDDERLFGAGLTASDIDDLTPDEQRRALHHLQIETRVLRETLERAARHAHDADPSTSHVAVFERCPHPMCRQARALLPNLPDPETGDGPIPSPQEGRRLGAVDRGPRARDGEDPVEFEGLGGAADATGSERSDDEDVEPSWIPLDQSPPPPPPRRPASSPIAAPSGAEEPPPATPVPEEPLPAEPPPEVPRVVPPPSPPSPRPPAQEPGLPPGPPRPAEPSTPFHLFEAPSPQGPDRAEQVRPDMPRPATAEPPPEIEPEQPPETEVSPAEAPHGRDRPPQPPPGAGHVLPPRDPNIADAAADAIDRLARALFGPKRPRQ